MLRLLILTLIFASCVPAQKKAATSSGAAGNSNAPSRWPLNSFPKTVRIANTFTAAEVTALNSSGDDWSTTVGHSMNFFTFPAALVANKGNVSDLDDLFDHQFGIYKSTTWHPDLPATALAVTQIYGVRQNTGSANEYVEIVEADVLVNWSFAFAPADPTGYDLYSVVLHEMGHFLGLNHVYDYSLDSVMFPTISPSTVFPGPGADDVDAIIDRYHSSSSFSAVMAQAQTQAIEVASDPEAVWNSGKGVKIMIELHANGTCVHKVDGIQQASHPINLHQFKGTGPTL